MKYEVICPYCGSQAELVDGSRVYGEGFRDRFKIYLCPNWPNCDSYVGTHGGGKVPLGRMANAELRHWKKQAHAAFDQLWKSGKMGRHKAYGKLSRYLEKPPEETHIGMFDIPDCKKVIQFAVANGIAEEKEPEIPDWMK